VNRYLKMPPKTCCSCQEEPSTKDACMCGCGFLNGAGPVLGTQMLVLMGLLFSLAALGDCSFVKVGERIFSPTDLDESLPVDVTQSQYVGFLTWQKLDGMCYWYSLGANPENQVEKYFDLLGSDWDIPRIMGGMSASLAFYLFCYLLSFNCSSQVRGVRYFNIFILSAVLTTMQGLTFLVFQSSFCEENGCSPGRGAGFSIAAVFCFFIAGLIFWRTTDYPGDRVQSEDRKVTVLDANGGAISESKDEEDPAAKTANGMEDDEQEEMEQIPLGDGRKVVPLNDEEA